MKRVTSEGGGSSSGDSYILSLANCLIMLSRGEDVVETSIDDESSPERVFECKTCNRRFPSFQALGGHRASHKRLKLSTDGPDEDHSSAITFLPIAKPKLHQCPVCGLEFGIGQALGGHMRRHRAVTFENYKLLPPPPLERDPSPPYVQTATKRSNGKSGVSNLDLNLTPVENDLEFRIGMETKSMIQFYL